MNESNLSIDFSLDSGTNNDETNQYVKELELLQKQAKAFFINNDILKKQNANNKLKTNFILNKNSDDLFKKKNYIENNHSKEYTLTTSQWKYIIRNDKRKNISYSILKTSLKNGIDNELRPRIWSFLINLESFKKNYSPSIYEKLTKMKNSDEVQILKDISRTYSDEFIFNKDNENNIQQTLKNVLMAYSNFDKEVGYVQGMNFIAAGLLYNLHHDNFKNVNFSFGRDNQNYEELSFWMLVYIFYEINWRSIYVNNFPKLHSILETLNIKIKDEFNDLFNKFQERGINLLEIFGPCIFSIILYKIPVKYSNIIFDLFLLEEEKIIFEVILRLIDLNYTKIYSLNTKEDIWYYFSQNFFQDSFNENQDNIKIIFPYPLIENMI